MVIQTETYKSGVSLAIEFQKYMSTAALEHGVIAQGKYKKWASKKNWTEREYHSQNDSDVVHKYMKTFCNLKSFHYCHFVIHTQNHMVSES